MNSECTNVVQSIDCVSSEYTNIIQSFCEFCHVSNNMTQINILTDLLREFTTHSTILPQGLTTGNVLPSENDLAMLSADDFKRIFKSIQSQYCTLTTFGACVDGYRSEFLGLLSREDIDSYRESYDKLSQLSVNINALTSKLFNTLTSVHATYHLTDTSSNTHTLNKKRHNAQNYQSRAKKPRTN